jgi:hypothetical protein
MYFGGKFQMVCFSLLFAIYIPSSFIVTIKDKAGTLEIKMQ